MTDLGSQFIHHLCDAVDRLQRPEISVQLYAVDDGTDTELEAKDMDRIYSLMKRWGYLHLLH